MHSLHAIQARKAAFALMSRLRDYTGNPLIVAIGIELAYQLRFAGYPPPPGNEGHRRARWFLGVGLPRTEADWLALEAGIAAKRALT